MDTEEPRQDVRELSNNTNADDLPQDLLHEIYEKATEVSVHSLYVLIFSHNFMLLQLKDSKCFGGSCRF